MKKSLIILCLIALVASCTTVETPKTNELVEETIQENAVEFQASTEVQRQALAIIDGEAISLNVFENGSKAYTTTAELMNGEHSMSSFVYNGNEYLSSPLTFSVDNAKVKQITINQTRSRSLIYEDLDFGYLYAEFEGTVTVPFHVILGVPDSLFNYYEGSNYQYQPEGIQTLMKGIFRVQYYHDSTLVAMFGVLDYNDGAVNVEFIPGNNFFRIQHTRFLPGVGMVDVVGNDYTIFGDPVTGGNGVVNIEILPGLDWVDNANYNMIY